MTKLQAAEQLRHALQIFAQTLTDEEALEVACVYPAWEENKSYKVNTMVIYGENAVGDPQLYRCAQAHTSQSNWTPDITAALWTPIGLADDGIAVWSQPTGAHDAYRIGDKVHYPTASDPIYICISDYNIYAPDVAGWELFT